MKATISITEKNGKFAVSTPYHPEFVKICRALGARWDAREKVWLFELRKQAEDAVNSVFGLRDEFVDVIIELDIYECDVSELWAFGRRIAWRPDRDMAVRLADGVAILTGGFSPRGGSRKYPSLSPEAGTCLLVKNVSADLVSDTKFFKIVEVKQSGESSSS